MKHSLYLKFILAYVIFGLLSFVTVATFSSQMTLNYLTDKKAEDLYREANHISSNFVRNYYSDAADSRSLSTIYSHFQALDTYLGASIWLLNTDGTMLVNSETGYSGQSSTVIEDFDPTDMGNRYYLVGDFYGMFREDTLSVAAPVTYNFKPRGYVLIHLPMSALTMERDSLLNITYLTLLFLFLFSLLVLGVFTFTVYRPLLKITAAARQYAEGNFSYALELAGEDEIGQLAATLNYMAHELKETDEYQKKFVANISHDFRSPLTSIKGYVEAILDGTIPPELQEKYLNIVLMETERLTKLTNGLLTLNSFDTKKNRWISRTSISTPSSRIRWPPLRAAVQPAISPLSCSSTPASSSWRLIWGKSSRLCTIFWTTPSSSVPTIPRSPSRPPCATRKVFISVKDQGIGIPRDSMKKIWERFYKTDSSRGKDKKGTGLGLSIVKEIITSHGEHINAISTEGVGTEFIFTLPRVHTEEG